MRRVLVTGGAGFIGSALVRELLLDPETHVIDVDKLTYAASLESLAELDGEPRHVLERADICDVAAVRAAFDDASPVGVFHLAAESHVDRSIDGPGDFVRTNVVGTFTLLAEALRYYRAGDDALRARFRFHHVSTDEVFGSLGDEGRFHETTAYDPRSPYSATKASSDHLVRAWHHTYGLPVVLTNCSNNYGPRQFPEKLIPLVIIKALLGESLPVYGKGTNVRDWLHVEDHARALAEVLARGTPGRSYNIGGDAERQNLDVVHAICDALDGLVAPLPQGPRRQLVTYVTDRPGHDHRYAMDATRIRDELGWTPRETFDTGLRKTVEWYLSHRGWWQRIRAGAYQGERLGLTGASRAP